MSDNKVTDKHGHIIKHGDYVVTKIRGGTHEGHLEEIISDQQKADEVDVKNPPKVRFKNKDDGSISAKNAHLGPWELLLEALMWFLGVKKRLLAW
ncbi:hypothetical protein PENANT_c070G08481 [Penicillium antarcticum]|uniref:Hypervirulence associated protein TUDOR domain-containing protein n=1 Tax=Penicillium antarcticum TaxID=416450 RepID=A0A1V6PQX7_9EURO|nr:hypothetical protein PENANT_c070G08481 [Penicillium antarcticum]